VLWLQPLVLVHHWGACRSSSGSQGPPTPSVPCCCRRWVASCALWRLRGRRTPSARWNGGMHPAGTRGCGGRLLLRPPLLLPLLAMLMLSLLLRVHSARNMATCSCALPSASRSVACHACSSSSRRRPSPPGSGRGCCCSLMLYERHSFASRSAAAQQHWQQQRAIVTMVPAESGCSARDHQAS
jgi:hypothetical protein